MPRPLDTKITSRVGRFSKEAGSSETKVDIATCQTQQLYRVINPESRGFESGMKPVAFEVEVGGTKLNHKVTLGSSLDFAMKVPQGASEIAVNIVVPADSSGGTGKPDGVRGMYEFLSNLENSQSGRFRAEGSTEHYIIDFSKTADVGAMYRIFNSTNAANRTFNVKRTNDKGAPTILATLSRGESFDFFCCEWRHDFHHTFECS